MSGTGSARWPVRAAEGLAYTALTLLLTWPLAARPTTLLPGTLPESGQFVWAMHAALGALRARSDPLITHDLFAPQGAALVLHTALIGPALALSPVTALWGPVAATTLWVLACLVLTALCGAALARRRGVSRPIAWWCGAAVAYCPFMAARLGGHFNLIAVWEVLLAWLLAHRCRRAGRSRADAAAWGLLLGFSLLTDYQLALFAAGATLLAVAPRGTDPAGRRRAVGALLPAAVLPAAVTAVLAAHLHAVGGLAPIPGSDTAASLAYRIHLRDLVTRGGTPGTGAAMESAGYPGIVPLAGCLAAVVLAWRSRRVARAALPPLALALACAVLALGPTLTLDAASTPAIGGAPILLPYALLLFVGAADVMREPARFVLPMTLAAAACAAIAYDAGAAALAARRGGGRLLPIALAAALVALTLWDTWPGPLALTAVGPLRDDPAVAALRGVAPGIVLDLPTERITGQWHIGCRRDTLDDIVATLGDHPLVGGYLSRAPSSAAITVLHDGGLMALQPGATRACSAASFPGGVVAAPRAAEVAPALRRLRVRAVLVAPPMYGRAELARVEGLLAGAGYVRRAGGPRYLLYTSRT